MFLVFPKQADTQRIQVMLMLGQVRVPPGPQAGWHAADTGDEYVGAVALPGFPQAS